MPRSQLQVDCAWGTHLPARPGHALQLEGTYRLVRL